MGRTLYDKLWDAHLVDERDDGSALIYIDRHLIHEVTSPQAFEGLRLQNRLPRRLNANVAVPDHNVSTDPDERSLAGYSGVADTTSRLQLETLNENCDDFKIPLIDLSDQRQGIVHVMGPEQGATSTWYDHCLWRFSHLDSRRIWCTGTRYWYVGSRTCAGNAMSAHKKDEELSRHY